MGTSHWEGGRERILDALPLKAPKYCTYSKYKSGDNARKVRASGVDFRVIYHGSPSWNWNNSHLLTIEAACKLCQNYSALLWWHNHHAMIGESFYDSIDRRAIISSHLGPPKLYRVVDGSLRGGCKCRHHRVLKRNTKHPIFRSFYFLSHMLQSHSALETSWFGFTNMFIVNFF